MNSFFVASAGFIHWVPRACPSWIWRPSALRDVILKNDPFHSYGNTVSTAQSKKEKNNVPVLDEMEMPDDYRLRRCNKISEHHNSRHIRCKLDVQNKKGKACLSYCIPRVREALVQWHQSQVSTQEGGYPTMDQFPQRKKDPKFEQLTPKNPLMHLTCSSRTVLT